jgi:hypothetical protein
MTPEIQTQDDRKTAFKYIQLLWMNDEHVLRHLLSKLPSTAPKVIGELYGTPLPVDDISDPCNESSEGLDLDQGPDMEDPDDSADMDMERFPQDLPNELIVDFISHKNNAETK